MDRTRPTLEVTISTGALMPIGRIVTGWLLPCPSGEPQWDSLLHYNLLSSALNQILELAFRSHAPGAAITCSLLRKEGLDRVVLSVPGNEELSTAYRKMVGDAGRDNSAERLASEILAGAPASAGLSLMELAANYKAEFRLEISDDRRISLVTDLALEDDEL
jgi:hypothetical protein